MSIPNGKLASNAVVGYGTAELPAPHQTLSALIQTCSGRRPRKSSFLAPGVTDNSPPLLPTVGNVLEMLHDESPSRIPVMSFY